MIVTKTRRKPTKKMKFTQSLAMPKKMLANWGKKTMEEKKAVLEDIQNTIVKREEDLEKLEGTWQFRSMVNAFEQQLKEINKKSRGVRVTNAEIELEFVLDSSKELSLKLANVGFKLAKGNKNKHRMKLFLEAKKHRSKRKTKSKKKT